MTFCFYGWPIYRTIEPCTIILYEYNHAQSSPTPDTNIMRIMHAAATERFTLLLPDELLDELGRTLASKKDVMKRVTTGEATT